MRPILLLILTIVSPVVFATEFEKCSYFFFKNTPPLTTSLAKTRALCFNEFAVMHSGESKTPVYVAQVLTRESVNAQVKRANKFFADARLPRSERAELDDYKNSGYDRGHMAPAADMATEEGMAQCFSLANMVPQDSKNNQRIWSKIEEATRKYVQRARGNVYVITGPVFEKAPQTIGLGKVWVPSHLFKLIHDPGANKTFAYWIENRPDTRVEKPISYSELEQKVGFRLLKLN